MIFSPNKITEEPKQKENMTERHKYWDLEWRTEDGEWFGTNPLPKKGMEMSLYLSVIEVVGSRPHTSEKGCEAIFQEGELMSDMQRDWAVLVNWCHRFRTHQGIEWFKLHPIWMNNMGFYFIYDRLQLHLFFSFSHLKVQVWLQEKRVSAASVRTMVTPYHVGFHTLTVFLGHCHAVWR